MRITALLLCFSVTAFAEQHDVHTFFKSIEHQWLGEQVNLEFPGIASVSTREHLLNLPNENKLSYGEIISLAGDYYGIPELPISDGQNLDERMRRFHEAFDTLANEGTPFRCDYDYCSNKILDVFEQELVSYQKNRTDRMGSKGLDYLALVEYYTANNFLRLAITNWDHFLPTSLLAYEAGHAAAIEQALRARKLASEADQTAALELAYAMNAFSDHFLTDMFSSGHLRVPRRQLYEQSSFASVAGLLAKQMHDEDGRVGLMAENHAGATWKMYGDGMLFVAGAEKNKDTVSQAIRTSIAEVANAFKNGVELPVEDYGVKKLVPIDLPKLNSSPLYLLDLDGTVLARTPENSLCSYEWTPDWTGISQLLGYDSAGDGSDCKFNAELMARL